MMMMIFLTDTDKFTITFGVEPCGSLCTQVVLFQRYEHNLQLGYCRKMWDLINTCVGSSMAIM